MGFYRTHVAILAEHQYEDLELWYPNLRFKEEGYTVSVIGAGEEVYYSKHQYPVHADARIDNVDISGFDAIVIPGGYAPDHLRRNAQMVEFVRSGAELGKVIGAICHAGWMLISAGILQGKHVTGFHSIKDDLVNAGAHFEDKPVVVDGNLITSRKPSDLPDFCAEMIKAISRKPVGVHDSD